MNEKFEHLRAVVFDLAGTTVDFGSCAPASVFQEVFRQRGVGISQLQAREPMGQAKRDHIWSILRNDDVAAKWLSATGAPATNQDVDQLYEAFLPLQEEVLHDHCGLIGDVAATIQTCKDRGLRIGCTTGYTRSLINIVLEEAAKQGFEPEFALGAEDAPRGRPAPFLLHEAAKRLDVYPMYRIVKMDDTPVGIEAGRNAGCWTVGISKTGNCVGLSQQEWSAKPPSEQRDLVKLADEKLRAAGAHVVIESTDQCLPLLEEFERSLAQGQRP